MTPRPRPSPGGADDPGIELLLGQLERAFDRRSWHGPNLLGSVRRLDPASAAWRPGPERHNAWEIVVHAAYWKYRLCRHLAADPPAAFTLPGSDWWVRPVPDRGGGAAAKRASEPDAEQGADLSGKWRADVALLKDWHAELLTAVRAFDPARLDEPATSEWSYVDLIAGGAAHDLYHAGQIRLLVRMRGAATGR